jgi:hypothetical protein
MYDQPRNDFASEWHTLASVAEVKSLKGDL